MVAAYFQFYIDQQLYIDTCPMTLDDTHGSSGLLHLAVGPLPSLTVCHVPQLILRLCRRGTSPVISTKKSPKSSRSERNLVDPEAPVAVCSLRQLVLPIALSRHSYNSSTTFGSILFNTDEITPSQLGFSIEKTRPLEATTVLERLLPSMN